MSTNALIKLTGKEKQVEIAFITTFSVLIFAIFYVLISMNGVVLGNDPAVHLEKAQIFLQTRQIPLDNLGWIPPLYQIVLAMFITFSGATDVGQLIFLVKALAVIINWLLFMSVYLIARKFFSRRVGVVASVLLLMCFPIYEANAFGGYTTVLALAFMLLVFLYTPLAVERFGYLVVAFFSAFALVLSHQLATFLAVFIMPPVLLFMLIKSKGAHLKVVMALIFGGGIAFFLYYFQAMIGYLDLVVEYVFFAIKAYVYQIPAVTFNAFMINFGFIVFFGLAGIAVAFYLLRKQRKPLLFMILMLAFFVPLFFAESWLVGLYVPFGWFIYYLTTPLVIFAAVFVVFAADKAAFLYAKNRKMFKKNWVKIATIGIIVLLTGILVYRSSVVYGRIMEASVYYSRTDIKALEAGIWLGEHYPYNTTVVVTEVPGFWFRAFSGKNVVAQTEQAVHRNELAESVLSMSHELEHPQTLLRAYEAKGHISDENWVSIDQVWYRVSFSSDDGSFLSYSKGGIDYTYSLSGFSRQVVFEDSDYPKMVAFIYVNDDVALTKTVHVNNDNYASNVSWTLTPLKTDISNITLYISTFFDLQFNFNKAQIPQLLDWINPRNASQKTIHDTWVVAVFSDYDLKDSYLGLYDEKNELAFAFKFETLPGWGNIGAGLSNGQIDAVRFHYQFSDVRVNQTVTCSYQVLSLSKNSYPALQPNTLASMFNHRPAPFVVESRDFWDYVEANDVGFIVYDRNKLDTQMINSKLLELIYSNDRYVIFKIKR